MNNRQKKVTRTLLKNEKQVLEELKANYEKALNDINNTIASLLGRTDVENLQSIMYQVDYQRSLKKQIEAFLDILNTNNFTTISDYLEKSYNESWVGTLFDLQGQGVPLFIPIDQKQVVKAIVTDSKLSKRLYKKLNIDIDELKTNIQTELSRGIAQGLPFKDIARNLKLISGISLNNSIRIARTESHRISQEATYNCQKKAVSKGADIVKVWDATLDKHTRPSHQLLDGQMVGVNQPFKNYKGDEAMFPSGFGIASEDINCRCCVISRAKWALSDEEFSKMNGDTNELQHFENVEDYEKFKSEFWSWERNNE